MILIRFYSMEFLVASLVSSFFFDSAAFLACTRKEMVLRDLEKNTFASNNKIDTDWLEGFQVSFLKENYHDSWKTYFV